MESTHGRLINFLKLIKENFGAMLLKLGATNGMVNINLPSAITVHKDFQSAELALVLTSDLLLTFYNLTCLE